MRAFLILGLLRLFAALPLPQAHRLGSVLGWLAAHTPNSLRRVTRANLALCFPDQRPAARTRLLGLSLAELGKTAVELGALWLQDTASIKSQVKQVSGQELVDAALKRGKGVILASPHLGAWEMAGLYASSLYPLTSLYRPLRLSALDTVIRQARERLGARLVATDAAGIRALYRALKRGEAVGVLPDQEPSAGGGLFAPFFGVSAYTMVLLARLAQGSQAPVFFAYAERLPRGAGYHLRFSPAPDDFHALPLAQAVAMTNALVERCVRALPEQYQWSYKRFRTRPQAADRDINAALATTPSHVSTDLHSAIVRPLLRKPYGSPRCHNQRK